MNCPSCSHSNEEGAKFCAGCGDNLESFWAEFDQPDALVQYREELTDYLGDQELEEWEEEELEKRRGELKVTVAAHDALVEEMGGTADDPIPVSILIDTAQIGKFHVGGSSVFSFQFENQTERAIRSVELSFRDTEFSVEEVFSVKTKPIRPGGSTQGQVVATLGQSGAHQLSGEVTVVRTGSDPDQFEFEPITYDVGRDSDTPTNITMDMSGLRVADMGNAQIGGSTGTQSGVVSDRSWLPLKLIRVSTAIRAEEENKRQEAESERQRQETEAAEIARRETEEAVEAKRRQELVQKKEEREVGRREKALDTEVELKAEQRKLALAKKHEAAKFATEQQEFRKKHYAVFEHPSNGYSVILLKFTWWPLLASWGLASVVVGSGLIEKGGGTAIATLSIMLVGGFYFGRNLVLFASKSLLKQGYSHIENVKADDTDEAISFAEALK